MKPFCLLASSFCAGGHRSSSTSAGAGTSLRALMFYVYLHSSYIFFVKTFNKLGLPWSRAAPAIAARYVAHLQSPGALQMCSCNASGWEGRSYQQAAFLVPSGPPSGFLQAESSASAPGAGCSLLLRVMIGWKVRRQMDTSS